MNGKKINISQIKSRVLVAPLDWGLGHATRCIPLINEFITLGYEVIIAAEKATGALLKAEFPALTFLSLKGYEINYSRSRSMTTTIALQMPKIRRIIKYENKWLKKIVVEQHIDLVISDNRPGLYHKVIPCMYITHQLNIPARNFLSGWITKKLHYHYINKFSACLVPDAEGSINLAGSLSHPEKLPLIPVEYIGPLSRFKLSFTEKKYDLLILLSGPEPQRSLFEVLLLKQLKSYTGSCLFVRGLPGQQTTLPCENKNIQLVNHLPATILNIAMQQAEIVLARSGYTTVMDLVKLKQKAILVATPGQPEQEYLAETLMKKGLFYSTDQPGFLLQNALKSAASFSYRTAEIDFHQYKQALKKITDNVLAQP
jgi:hypothetical protein